MNVCGINDLLRVVSFVVCVALFLPTPIHAQPPGSFTGLLRLGDFDSACSKDLLDERTDDMCRQAIAIALGKEPMLEEVRRPDGTVARTTKLGEPDQGKAGWLGEEACEHGQWRSCMLYTMLLERGDGVPLDRQRAEMLVHYACAKGHRLACQSLHQKGITPTNVALTERPAWVSRSVAEKQRRTETDALAAALLQYTEEQRRKQEEQAQQKAAPAAPAPVAEPVSNAAAAEAALIAKCMAASRDACYDLARGYDRGEGMPRDPARASFYYEKACEAGHSAACAQRGKVPGAPSTASSAPMSNWMFVAVAMALVVGVAVVVLRRRGNGNDVGERPAPVRPAAAPRPPR